MLSRYLNRRPGSGLRASTTCATKPRLLPPAFIAAAVYDNIMPHPANAVRLPRRCRRRRPCRRPLVAHPDHSGYAKGEAHGKFCLGPVAPWQHAGLARGNQGRQTRQRLGGWRRLHGGEARKAREQREMRWKYRRLVGEASVETCFCFGCRFACTQPSSTTQPFCGRPCLP